MALKRAGAHRQLLSLCTIKESCVLSSLSETTESNYVDLSLPVANADLLQRDKYIWTTVIYRIWCTGGAAFNQGCLRWKESGFLSSFLFPSAKYFIYPWCAACPFRCIQVCSHRYPTVIFVQAPPYYPQKPLNGHACLCFYNLGSVAKTAAKTIFYKLNQILLI